MTQPNAIAWHPIETMPADRRDGRRILLWADGEPEIGVWSKVRVWGAGPGWNDVMDGDLLGEPTHWADIVSPAAIPVRPPSRNYAA
ncbi:MAG TPA: hypothetical protein VGE05_02415 [Novosphingobium sp.]